ncbi:MAG TPA: ABC transporter substrate-binding protein [Spirochaetia bacterium]|nr:ABC transporter substrate-binding protein [Spirochaetia bacterium]
MMGKLVVFAALILPFALGAQGTSLAGVDPAGAKISFWYQHSGDRDKAMQGMIDEFNRANPWKITVHGEYAGPYDQVYNKMVAAIAAGKPPELVVAYQNQSATYAGSQALTDLDPYVHDPTWGIERDLGDFFSGFLSQDVTTQFGGMRLGFPPNRSIEVLYYNASVMKAAGIAAPPRTWEEFAADCRRLTNKQADSYGYALDNIDASHVFAAVISRGGGFVTPDGRGYALNTPQMKDSMVFMRDLLRGGWARKIAKKFDDQTEFGNEKSAFTLGSTSGLTYYAAAVKAGKNGVFDWGIAPVPQAAPTRSPAIDLYGASVSVPRSTPQKQLAAWLFIRWFSEPRQQAAWTHVSLYFPVRKSAEPLIRDILRSDPRFARAWELLKTADLKSEPAFAGYDLVRDAISAAYSRVLDGADVDSTLEALQAQAVRIFRESAP